MPDLKEKPATYVGSISAADYGRMRRQLFQTAGQLSSLLSPKEMKLRRKRDFWFGLSGKRDGEGLTWPSWLLCGVMLGIVLRWLLSALAVPFFSK